MESVRMNSTPSWLAKVEDATAVVQSASLEVSMWTTTIRTGESVGYSVWGVTPRSGNFGIIRIQLDDWLTILNETAWVKSLVESKWP